MKIAFDKTFHKDIEKLHNKKLAEKLKSLINTIKKTDSPINLTNLKKLEGYDFYYRMKIGDYRIGLKIIDDTATLIRFLHRKDIYRYFPK